MCCVLSSVIVSVIPDVPDLASECKQINGDAPNDPYVPPKRSPETSILMNNGKIYESVEKMLRVWNRVVPILTRHGTPPPSARLPLFRLWAAACVKRLCLSLLPTPARVHVRSLVVIPPHEQVPPGHSCASFDRLELGQLALQLPVQCLQLVVGLRMPGTPAQDLA